MIHYFSMKSNMAAAWLLLLFFFPRGLLHQAYISLQKHLNLALYYDNWWFQQKVFWQLGIFFFFKVRIPILTVPNNSPLLYWALPHWKLNANSNQTKQVGKQYSLCEEDKNDCWCFRNQGLSCFQITRKTKINVFKQLPKTSSEVDYLHYEI